MEGREGEVLPAVLRFPVRPRFPQVSLARTRLGTVVLTETKNE